MQNILEEILYIKHEHQVPPQDLYRKIVLTHTLHIIRIIDSRVLQTPREKEWRREVVFPAKVSDCIRGPYA
jgi:hypothetical protein